MPSASMAIGRYYSILRRRRRRERAAATIVSDIVFHSSLVLRVNHPLNVDQHGLCVDGHARRGAGRGGASVAGHGRSRVFGSSPPCRPMLRGRLGHASGIRLGLVRSGSVIG